MEIKRIAVDTSKHVFTLVAVDGGGHAVLRRELKRHQVEPFFRKQPSTEVVLEACGGSHHWGRTDGARAMPWRSRRRRGGRMCARCR